jgi:5'-nucleotidase
VIDNKRVTSAQSFGRLVTEIDLKLDARTGDVIQHDATNLIVRSEGEKDPAQTALIERYARLAAPIENRPVGKVRGFLAGRGINENGESPLGRLIADAHWAAMSGPEYGRAELAVANLGGIRADLKPAEDGSVNYGQLYTTQPFGNNLVTISLRGADLIELLEQQFRDDGFEPLQWSSTLFYRYNPKAPQGSRVDVESIRIRGQAIDRDRYYRIATTTFLAGGADGFSVFKKARQLATGPIDLDALVDYIKAGQALTQDDAPRMVKE